MLRSVRLWPAARHQDRRWQEVGTRKRILDTDKLIWHKSKQFHDRMGSAFAGERATHSRQCERTNAWFVRGRFLQFWRNKLDCRLRKATPSRYRSSYSGSIGFQAVRATFGRRPGSDWWVCSDKLFRSEILTSLDGMARSSSRLRRIGPDSKSWSLTENASLLSGYENQWETSSQEYYLTNLSFAWVESKDIHLARLWPAFVLVGDVVVVAAK